ncbi:MAG: tRNA (adenosine(37)-N6)-threonylcarbamoyltransferase complex dimerization subunit type 1 TsaB [Brevundimonas subvibrioides]|uniref:tRNA (Adenosine(37)-N6)-threonylcarbamoyltransferase complex dimerization subunit type 1 TsaB n=1 Tax=Brevundimonas subvibrioides TaxID=74313 RepID=A0A258HPI5_9CAUL|nr:tRNA (adenosine(37)-N6)-threonylcarbamoyltransferase complex dimerization subunit type 1 TsaB [Brevundimonas subvibrioides]OYX58282.1 MAG: tRNA (adenosine(37)-N6)-threonylcarbamoyltransferase complex dimerization subunit type 1 TsaB [Brevundimonas subvibrioides]
MRVLVIDTALDACTAAVFEEGRALGLRSEVMARGHSERLGGFVRDAVAEAGGGFEALDRIGVTVGPGSFTGLRVGLAFAQGLGAALGLPVVGISTLAALARSADGGQGTTAAVIDARRGQVYLQLFETGHPASEPEAVSLEDAIARLADRSWRITGSGATLVGGEVSTVTAPDPAALAALTVALDPAIHPPRPLYLRAPDATPPTRLPGQARPVVSGA